MGVNHANGYSAAVEAFFVVGDSRLKLAKTRRDAIVFAEPPQFPPGTLGQLVVSVDGSVQIRDVVLVDGVDSGWEAKYVALSAMP